MFNVGIWFLERKSYGEELFKAKTQHFKNKQNQNRKVTYKCTYKISSHIHLGGHFVDFDA